MKIRMQIPACLFLCAGAVLESPRLAKGSPEDAKSPMLSRDTPKTSQWRPRCPKVCPKTAQGAPKRPQRSPKERQKERNAVPRACLGTPKCVQRSPIYPKTLGFVLLLSLVLIPLPLHYYPYYYTTTGGEWWGLVCPARLPERPPIPRSVHTTVLLLLLVLI